MSDLTRSSATKVKIPPPLNLHPESQDDDTLNPRTARILKNDLLLHEAVIKNEPETVRKVLQETVAVDSRNNYGRAPIHWAASRGNTEIIEMLIRAECDIEARDKFGMRPLHMAAWYGHLEAVRMLIDAGASVTAVNKKKYTLLMCASRGNNADVIEYLTGAVETLNIDAIDCTGATALHHAAVSGNPGVIEALSKIPEIKLDVTDKKQQTPLHCSCADGHGEAVEILIKLGANLNSQDKDGNTPMHVATRMRYTGIVQTLLKANADIEIADEAGLTALHVAASQGCKGILELILQHSSITNVQCNAGNTALHLACQNNQVDSVEILIKHGADLNSLNSKLQTPIHIAAEVGHTDVCKLLLAAGVNIEQKEKSGKTPLYIAAGGSFTAIVDMIIKTARLEYLEDQGSEKNGDLIPVSRRWREEARRSTVSGVYNGGITEHVRCILRRLAYKQLDAGDWRKLALHWAFTHDHIHAIEQQYTGSSSYKEHGYRMLMIWASGLSPELQLSKELHEALLAIDKKNVADKVEKHLDQGDDDKSDKQRCHRCTVT
ncbi:ankyrin repeat and death domain-containing protein 1A [Diachasma alloeum]|uniref:ankyrin repeat and death domain-containing protein 1A n=1 Tax=Diachasma alloeum TaxID=454923 RepID=UPI0007384FD6|nr:ankyrin repeat and death domain-containing protein 1A [Diachasma alloeum]